MLTNRRTPSGGRAYYGSSDRDGSGSISCSEWEESAEAAQGGVRQSVHSPAAAVDGVRQRGPLPEPPDHGLVVAVAVAVARRDNARVHWPPPGIRRTAAAATTAGQQADECLWLSVVALSIGLRLRRARRAGEAARRGDRPVRTRAGTFALPLHNPPALTSPSDPDAPYRTWRGPFLVTHSGRAAEAGGGRPATAPQPGDPGQGRAVRGRQAPREGLGSGARGAARRRAGGAARAPPRRGGRVAGQGALGAGRRGHPARAAPAAGRRAGVGRGAARRRWRRRRRGAVLVVGVRGPSALGPRVPGLPPEAGLRRAHPLQAPPALRRVLRRRRRGRRHGVPRVPVRADGQRGGHPLLSVARLAVHLGSR
jgi:hypothetical protein